MCTIVGATLPTEEFALKDTFAEYPRATFEAVRTSAHDTDRPMSLLWAMGPDPEAIDSALRADGTTEDVRVFTRADGRRLYWIDWEPRIYSLLRTLVESGGTVLEAGATDSRWTFELLFPDHDAASRTYDRWQGEGVDLVVREVRNDAGSVGLSSTSVSRPRSSLNVIVASTRFSWVLTEVISCERTIELIETTIETRRMIPLNSVFKILWRAWVSVASIAILKVHNVAISISAANTKERRAAVTAFLLPSSRIQRTGATPPFGCGIGNQSRHFCNESMRLTGGVFGSGTRLLDRLLGGRRTN